MEPTSALLVRIEDTIMLVQRKGVSMEKYLELYDRDSGQLPIYRARWEGSEQYFYTQEALDAFIGEEEKKASRELEVRTDGFSDPKEDLKPAIRLDEFHDAVEVAGAIKTLERLGFSARDFFHPIEVDGKPKHQLMHGEKSFPVGTLREVLKAIRTVGRQGLKEVKRFKGLGEMNAEELWDTTMDPDQRTLLQVSIEDGLQADRMFTVLMGEEVEPRREFIEKHALEVKFLDV